MRYYKLLSKHLLTQALDLASTLYSHYGLLHSLHTPCNHKAICLTSRLCRCLLFIKKETKHILWWKSFCCFKVGSNGLKKTSLCFQRLQDDIRFPLMQEITKSNICHIFIMPNWWLSFQKKRLKWPDISLKKITWISSVLILALHKVNNSE